MKDLDIGKLMEMAGNLQNIFFDLEEKLQKEEVEASIGGGMVKLKLNGLGRVIEFKIDEELIKTGDKNMIEDMVTAAIEVAINNLKELLQTKLPSLIMGGLPLGDLFQELADSEEDDDNGKMA